MNIKVRSEWLRNRDNPFPALYVYRFHSPTDHLHYVLTLFEPSLAEHLVINFLDDKEESATERGASQHAGVRRILEKYFGCALQHLHRKGRPLRQGTWRIPFGRGTLSREQVRSELERRILAYLPQPSRDEDSMVSRRPRQKAGESEAGTPPRFLGLWGAPGIGKTYLLNKMARSVILRMHFGSTICFLTMGQETTPLAIAAKKAELIAFLGQSPTANADLRKLTKGKRVLVILDDVHSAAQVTPFQSLSQYCCILASSRNRRVLDDVELPKQLVHLPSMSDNDARAVLTDSVADSGRLPTELLDELTVHCSGIPLALKIVGGLLNKKPESAGTIINRFEKPGSGRFKRLRKYLQDFTPLHEAEEGGETVLFNVLDVAINEYLSVSEFRDFRLLAATAKNTRIPISALETIWRADPGETRETIGRLNDLAMLGVDWDKQLIQIHEVIHAFLRAYYDDATASQYAHRTILRAYADRQWPIKSGISGKGGRLPWWELEDDGYIWSFIGHHLLGANWSRDLRGLLLDARYLSKRVTLGTVESLLRDFSGLPHELARPLVPLRMSLAGAFHILIRDPHQIWGVLSLLLEEEDSKYAKVLGRTLSLIQPPRPCLVPYSARGGTRNGIRVSSEVLIHEAGVSSFSMSEDLKTLMVATEEPSVTAWRKASDGVGYVKKTFPVPEKPLCIFQNGQGLLSVNGGRVLYRGVGRQSELKSRVVYTDFSPRDRISVSHTGNHVLLWDADAVQVASLVRKSEKWHFIPPRGQKVQAASFGAEFSEVAVILSDNTSRLRWLVFNVAKKSLETDNEFMGGFPHRFGYWTPKGCFVMMETSGDLLGIDRADASVHVLARSPKYVQDTYAFVVDERRDRFAIAFTGNRIAVVTGCPVATDVVTLDDHAASIVQMAFTTDANQFISADSAGVVRVWDLAQRTRTKGTLSLGSEVLYLAASDTGRRVALMNRQGAIVILDDEDRFHPWRAVNGCSEDISEQ
ncbi:MAG: hypothetical protein HUU46_07460 [Candidatus Hydrogenedentes bacterium]|nr:hypothetical protein [Candidatus Hydrogenedentota bacterium]